MARLTKKMDSVKKTPKKRGLVRVQKSRKTASLKVIAHSRDRKSINYQNYLIESLKDPEEAADYLNAALVEGDIKVFLIALQNVVQAQGKIV